MFHVEQIEPRAAAAVRVHSQFQPPTWVVNAVVDPSADGIALTEREPSDERAEDAALEATRRVHLFIRDRVIGPSNRPGRGRKGGLPSARTIAARLIVLQCLIEPNAKHSLTAIAARLGCTTAWLSIIATEFSASLGIRAAWQRSPASRESARASRDPSHVVTGKWERDPRRRKIANSARLPC